MHHGDLTDSSNITRIVKEVEPDEVYNLGAQSHVAVSFETPEYTAQVDALGTLRLLESIRLLGMDKKIRLTLDYPDDLRFFKELYKNIDILSSGKTIIDFCENNKSIMEINFHKHKDYLENQEKSVIKHESE